MQKIISRDNRKLKFVRKVLNEKESSAIFVEGTRLTEELLRSDLKIFECFVSESFGKNKKNQQLLAKICADSDKINEVSDKIFPSLSDTNSSQGIIIIAEKPETGKYKIEKSIDGDFRKFPFLMMLHQINNPSNLGAILRTSEAVGLRNVILTKNSADVFSAKSLRAAMGAAFRLNFWTDADFDEVLRWAQERNLTTACADINAENNFWETRWTRPTLLIFGSEARGLSAEERARIDESLYIPMESNVESLNLAVSAGIILYEAKRNWRVFNKNRQIENGK